MGRKPAVSPSHFFHHYFPLLRLISYYILTVVTEYLTNLFYTPYLIAFALA